MIQTRGEIVCFILDESNRMRTSKSENESIGGAHQEQDHDVQGEGQEDGSQDQWDTHPGYHEEDRIRAFKDRSQDEGHCKTDLLTKKNQLN